MITTELEYEQEKSRLMSLIDSEIAHGADESIENEIEDIARKLEYYEKFVDLT